MRFRSLGLLVAVLVPSLAAAGMEVWIDGEAASPQVSTLPDVAGVELAPPHEVVFGGRTHQHFQQQHAAIPVVGCGMDRVADDTGATMRVDAHLCPVAGADVFAVGPADAAATAESAIRALGTPERLIVATPVAKYRTRARDSGLLPIWTVDVATANPWGVWRVFVNGTTGAQMHVTDLALEATGRGLVFLTAKRAIGDRAVMRPLLGLDATGYQHGDVVMVDDITDFVALCPDSELFCAPPRVETCGAQGRGHTFAFSPRETNTFGTCSTADRFDQVTGYYQMSEMARYFSHDVGWHPGSNVL